MAGREGDKVPKIERVPSLADQLSCPDLAKAGYRYHVHVKRCVYGPLALRTHYPQRWPRALGTCVLTPGTRLLIFPRTRRA